MFKIPHSMLTEVTQRTRPQGEAGPNPSTSEGSGENGIGAPGRVLLEREMAQQIASMIVDSDRMGPSRGAKGTGGLADDVVSRMQTTSGLQASGPRGGFNAWAPHCQAASVPFLDPAHAQVCKDYLNGVLRDLNIHEEECDATLQVEHEASDVRENMGLHAHAPQEEEIVLDGPSMVNASHQRPIERIDSAKMHSSLKMERSSIQHKNNGEEDDVTTRERKERLDEVAFLTERLSTLLEYERQEAPSEPQVGAEKIQHPSAANKPREVEISSGGAGAGRRQRSMIPVPVKHDPVSHPAAGQAETSTIPDPYPSSGSLTTKVNAELGSVEVTAEEPKQQASALDAGHIRLSTSPGTSNLDGHLQRPTTAGGDVKVQNNIVGTGRRLIGTGNTEVKTANVAQKQASTARSVVSGRVTEMARVEAKHSRVHEVSQIMSRICKKLASRVKGLTAMFAEFDRPDWNGNSDKSIDFSEFEKVIMDLGLGLSSQQIRDVFNMVDKNGNGSIDLEEFESVLRAHGAIRPIAVKKADVKLMHTIDHSSRAAPKKPSKPSKAGSTRQLSQQPAGLTKKMSEQLTNLHQGLDKGQRMVGDLEGITLQFEALRNQYETAWDREQVAETLSLMTAAEDLVKRLDDGIDIVADHLETMHQMTVSIVHQLPADYRIVWKEALCREIDATSAQLRALVAKLPLLEDTARSLGAICHGWRKQSHQLTESDNKSHGAQFHHGMTAGEGVGQSPSNPEDDHAILMQKSQRWLTLTQHHSVDAPRGRESNCDDIMAARLLAQALKASDSVPPRGTQSDVDTTSKISDMAAVDALSTSAETAHGQILHRSDQAASEVTGAVPGQHLLNSLGGVLDYSRIKSELQSLKTGCHASIDYDASFEEASTDISSGYIASEVSMRVGRALRHLDSGTADDFPREPVIRDRQPQKTVPQAQNVLPAPRKMAFGRPVPPNQVSASVPKKKLGRPLATVAETSTARGKSSSSRPKVEGVDRGVASSVLEGRAKLATRRVSRRPESAPKASQQIAQGSMARRLPHDKTSSRDERVSGGRGTSGSVTRPLSAGHEAPSGEFTTHVMLELKSEHSMSSREFLSDTFAMAVGISPLKVACVEVDDLGGSSLQASIVIEGGLDEVIQKCASDVASALWASLPLLSISVGDTTFQKQGASGPPPRQDALASLDNVGAPELQADYEEVKSSTNMSPSSATGLPNLQNNEDALVDWVQEYLRQHLYGRVLMQTAAKNATPIKPPAAMVVECAGTALSDSSTRLLGAAGLELLVNAGVQVSDAEVLSIASEALETAAKQAITASELDTTDDRVQNHSDFDFCAADGSTALTGGASSPKAIDDRDIDALILRMFVRAVQREELEAAYSTMYLLGDISQNDKDEIPEPTTVRVGRTTLASSSMQANIGDVDMSNEGWPKLAHGPLVSKPCSTVPTVDAEKHVAKVTAASPVKSVHDAPMSPLEGRGTTVMAAAAAAAPPSQVSSNAGAATPLEMASLGPASSSAAGMPSSSTPLDETVRKIAESLQSIEERISTVQTAGREPGVVDRRNVDVAPEVRPLAFTSQDTGSIASEIALALHQHMKLENVSSMGEEKESNMVRRFESDREAEQEVKHQDEAPTVHRILVKDVSCETDAEVIEAAGAAAGRDVVQPFEEDVVQDAVESMSLASESTGAFGEEDMSAESIDMVSWISLMTRDVAVGSPLQSPRLTLPSHGDAKIVNVDDATKDLTADQVSSSKPGDDGNAGKPFCGRESATSAATVNETRDAQVQFSSSKQILLVSESLGSDNHDGVEMDGDMTQPMPDSDEDDDGDDDDSAIEGELSEGEMPESLLGMGWGGASHTATR